MVCGFPSRPTAAVARSGGRLRHRSGRTGAGAGPVGRGDSPGRRTVGPRMTQMDADHGEKKEPVAKAPGRSSA